MVNMNFNQYKNNYVFNDIIAKSNKFPKSNLYLPITITSYNLLFINIHNIIF